MVIFLGSLGDMVLKYYFLMIWLIAGIELKGKAYVVNLSIQFSLSHISCLEWAFAKCYTIIVSSLKALMSDWDANILDYSSFIF